jgi:uncharacterized protein YcbX
MENSSTTAVGQVESLWRYPVKSMRGEELAEAFLGFAGVFGDRVYAFHNSAAPQGFPYLTGREQETMLLYRPSYRSADEMRKPENLAEAEALAPGVTPLYPGAAERTVEVETPAGTTLSIDDPALLSMLSDGLRPGHTLTLRASERAMTDCRPISLFSIQTAQQLSQEVGSDLDKRRFRANVYLDLASAAGWSEDKFVGHTLQIGDKAVVAVLERDPRCKMITLDPDSAEPNPEVMKRVARGHQGFAGVYAAVLVEGLIRRGDAITLLH